MIGIILLATSWIALRFHRQGLRELGFNRPRQRMAEFSAGLALAAGVAALQYVLIAHFAGFSWQINPELSWAMTLESLRWNTNSVMFEELLFRGYLLWLGIRLLGPHKGTWLSAIAFGVYHWFSYGIWGQWINMAYVFLLTGAFGFMLAWAFAKTRSIFLPIALHLGWNLTTIFGFSNGPLGAQFLIPDRAVRETLSWREQIFTSIALPIAMVATVILVLNILDKSTAIEETADGKVS